MEVMSFLKAVPAVIGSAGLLTYYVRARKPESDLELANIVQRVRDTFLLLRCAAFIMLSVWLIRLPCPSRSRYSAILGWHETLEMPQKPDGLRILDEGGL
jgi:hypothetical protein